MTAQTYALLQSDAAAALQRTDLTARIVEFISNAEFKIARSIRPRGFERYTTSTFVAGSAGAVVDQPARLMGMISWYALADSAGTATGSIRYPVRRRSYSFCRAYNPNTSTTGRPLFWADAGDAQFLVAPSPSVAFTFELNYYERLAPLSASNTTNWLTDNCPQLLLYASLLESAPYLRDDERIAVWQAQYETHVAAITAVESMFDTADADVPRKQ